MKITYKVDFDAIPRIKKLRVVKETKGTITVIESSNLRNDYEKKYVKGNGRSFHDTWAEAKATLLVVAEGKVQYARRYLEIANSVLGNIKGMKEDES